MTNKQLLRFLRSGGLPSDRVRQGDIGVEQLPELRLLLEEVRVLSVPAEDEEKALILEKLFAHYPRPELTEGLARTRLNDWYDDLNGFPARALEAAAREYRRSTERFAPSPGQFLALVPQFNIEAHVARIAQLYIEAIEARSQEGSRA